MPVSPAMLKSLMVTGPSTLLVPPSRLPLVVVLSSATLRGSSASLKSSLAGLTVIVRVPMSVRLPSVTV
ncbi:hypothetical protein D3C78_1973190 [compost metagenome]